MPRHICSSCEYANRATHLFCTNCGKKLSPAAEAGPTLVLLDETDHTVFSLHHERSKIGRDRANEVVLSDNQISKEHAAIQFENGAYWVEDLESRNGIYVNGKKIRQRARLMNGSLVKLGSTILRFEHPA